MGRDLLTEQIIESKPSEGIKCADGKPLLNYGVQQLDLTLPGGDHFRVEALITTGTQCLLGMPFLRDGQAVIDVGADPNQ